MAHPHHAFRLDEKFERNGTVRLMLIGELDFAVVEYLSTRLRELRKGGYPVRLDLSELQFVDSSGVHEILRAISDARRDGWQLDIDGPLTDQVARTLELVGARTFLWPDEG
jgi:anti-sigma B factor antagonist